MVEEIHMFKSLYHILGILYIRLGGNYMKKILFILPLTIVLFAFLSSCTKNTNDDRLVLSSYSKGTIQKNNSFDKLELSKDLIENIITKINDANYVYENDENYNGWIYLLDFDDVSISFCGNRLYYVTKDIRKNYISDNFNIVIEYFDTVYASLV